ncbi:hypothetical protein EJ04DRAFT_423887 [Polyplosphaeria fusca]|uniref:DUF7580 domain-containing protein n=1 Tax=Polyplosphaeria fusca TaxID=682080 RepID=A0A9P4V7K1_9PLEO|nr:hypothetical protein EJ04DRAFT_423887 [Polyplosphaeria fusca]
MSGLEIAGLVFGVLPVLLEARRSYFEVSGYLHSFRHYSKEVRSIQVQFRVYHGIWLNECRLLLRLAIDEKGVEDMLDDELDKRWQSKVLNDKLNVVLKDSLDLCRNIIEASKEGVDEIKEELKKFNVLIEQRQQSESLKDTIRRLRKRIAIAFDKSKLEKSLAHLKDKNDDLSHLHSQIGAFQRNNPCSTATCIARKTLPTRVNTVRIASQALHEALSNAWCCSDRSHSHHYAKICLDPKVDVPEDDVMRLDLAISCQDSSRQDYISEPPIWLHVQSVSIMAPLPEPKAKRPRSSSPHDNNYNPSSISKPKAEACSKDQSQQLPHEKKKKKQVRFVGASNETIAFEGQSAKDVSLFISNTVAGQIIPGIDLCQTKNICHYLKQNLQICSQSLSRYCVGYLESPRLFKHNFYLRESYTQSQAKPLMTGQLSLYSLHDLMRQEVDDALTIVDQLNLARKTAVAMLQFSETPWLSSSWRLKDLSYFNNRDTFEEEALKTLHLSSPIAASAKSEMSCMEGVEDSKDAFTEEEYFGINNMAIFSLGVAFLELAHWKPIEALGSEHDPNAILTARRLASRPNPLGPKYQELALKCLQCNFGFGTDLSNKNLQAAVYGDVVCQLDKMIETLSI